MSMLAKIYRLGGILANLKRPARQLVHYPELIDEMSRLFCGLFTKIGAQGQKSEECKLNNNGLKWVKCVVVCWPVVVVVVV